MKSNPRLQKLKASLESAFGLTLPGLSKTIVWAIGFAILTGLTINDFFILLCDYEHNNVATQVEVILIAEDFKSPRPVIVIPVYKEANRKSENLMLIARHLHNKTEDRCELCQKLKENSWDVWRAEDIVGYLSYDFDTYYQALSMAFVRRLLQNMETDDKNIFDDISNSSWVDAIFSASLNFFMWQCNIDYHYKPVEAVESLWNVSSLQETVISVNKTGLDVLFSRVLSGLCQEVTLVVANFENEFATAEYQNTTCLDLLRDPTLPAAVDKFGLWAALPATARPQLTEYRFTFNSSSVWKDSYWSPKPDMGERALTTFMIYPDIGILYVGTFDWLFSSQIYDGKLEKNQRGKNVTLRYSVQLKAKENRLSRSSCYNGTSATVCFTKCTKQHVIDRCGCTPFSIHAGLGYGQDKRYCTYLDYKACNVTALPAGKKKLCIDKCKSACEYTSYTWHIDQGSYDPVEPNVTELTLRVAPTFNTFTQFSWTTKHTPEQFLSQIGGIVNLYLGVSGLSMIAFVFACIGILKRWKQNREIRVEGVKVEKAPMECMAMPQCPTDVKSLLEAWHGQMKRDIEKELQLLKAEVRAEMQKLKMTVKDEL